MNRYSVIFLLIVATPGQVLAEQEYLTELVSEAYETEGSKNEIATKAKSCVAQIVRFDSVKGTSSRFDKYQPLDSIQQFEKTADRIDGGNVFVTVDEPGGLIVANSRQDFSHKFMFAPIKKNVQSTVTIKTKDGRFRIEHSNIERMQKNTGSLDNDGYTPVGKWKGSDWKHVTEALQGLNAKVSECVKSSADEDDW
jgi:hypothetical protein